MRIHGLLPPAVKPLPPPPILTLFSNSLPLPFLLLTFSTTLYITLHSFSPFPFLGPYPSSHLFISLSLAAILPLTYLFLSQTLLSLPFSSLYLLLTIVSPSIPYVPLIDFTPVLPLTFSLYTSFPLLPNFHILTF